MMANKPLRPTRGAGTWMIRDDRAAPLAAERQGVSLQ